MGQGSGRVHRSSSEGQRSARLYGQEKALGTWLNKLGVLEKKSANRKEEERASWSKEVKTTMGDPGRGGKECHGNRRSEPKQSWGRQGTCRVYDLQKVPADVLRPQKGQRASEARNQS